MAQGARRPTLTQQHPADDRRTTTKPRPLRYHPRYIARSRLILPTYNQLFLIKHRFYYICAVVVPYTVKIASMAIVQYSALVTQLRGKLGGSQFNRGHSVQTLQRKSTPTIRQSPAQLAQRQRLAIAQRLWKTETDQRRSAVSQAAVSNPVYNRLGQQVVLSGYNQYVKIQTWRQALNVAGAQSGSLALPFVTTPVNPAAILINATAFGITVTPGGQTVLNMSIDRTQQGTPSGSTTVTRVYYFVTVTDAQGRPVPRARPVYINWSGYVGTTLIVTDLVVETQQNLLQTGYLLLEARTRHVSAGAETGYSSQIITL